VAPYRPRPDGGFDAPAVPATDPAGRLAVFEPSLLRRTATAEIPVTGGVAVLTAPVPVSRRHNQLLVDGTASAADVVADADRALAGLGHRWALLRGPHLAGTAAGLAEHGWVVEHEIGMAAPAGGTGTGQVAHVEHTALRPKWMDTWRRDDPGSTDAAVAQLGDRQLLEEPVVDVRYLVVREAGEVVAFCLLKIDGATAQLARLDTDPPARGRGHGNALVTEALAVAGAAGCDLVVLDALADDWPRHWYARRGFVEVAESWTVGRP